MKTMNPVASRILNIFLVIHTISVCGATFQENEVTLVSFDDPSNLPIWKEMNDPVMGGKSTGTFTVQDGMGLFEGEVVNVPFLHAPGFIQASTTSASGNFPNLNHCSSLAITCRGSTDYSGYKVSFGNQRGPLKCSFYSRGYKAPLNVTSNGNDFERIVIPFNEFSNCNSDGTGLPITRCEDDSSVCPDEKTLEDMKMITIWGEGIAGDVHLEIQRIEAIGCQQQDEEETNV
mmetsp:Transcript_11591/g.16243  ORF Transcript_11591/g.16243 Transcript_11591/m.16243 type:complete len:232 (-) Transcript_11591:102-797(-)